MAVVTRSKAKLGQPLCIVVYPKGGEVNCLRRVVESRQGNDVVAGHGEVGSPYPTCATANGGTNGIYPRYLHL